MEPQSYRHTYILAKTFDWQKIYYSTETHKPQRFLFNVSSRNSWSCWGCAEAARCTLPHRAAPAVERPALRSSPKRSVGNHFAKSITGTDADVSRRVLFLHFILVLECVMTTIELCSGLAAIHNNGSHIHSKSLSGNMLEAPGQNLKLAAQPTTNCSGWKHIYLTY